MEPADFDKFICFKCAHHVDGEPGCKAFPSGIPNEILTSNKHDKPLVNQGNDLVFTPKEATE